MLNMPQDDRLVYLILTAQHRLKLSIRDAFRAAGVEITLEQAGILFLLIEENGQAMSNLSRLLSLDNSTVTGLIDRLEKAGFARRRSNKNDRRVSLIHITPRGIKEAEKAGKVIKRVNGEIRAGFSKDEIESFKKVLNGVVAKFKKA